MQLIAYDKNSKAFFLPSKQVNIADVGDAHGLPFPQPVGVNDQE